MDGWELEIRDKRKISKPSSSVDKVHTSGVCKRGRRKGVARGRQQQFRVEMSKARRKECPEKSVQQVPKTVGDMPVGEVVWAKLGSSRWWPGVTISGADCGRPMAPPGFVWVFWYGDHKISQLPAEKVVNFVLNFGDKFSSFDGKLYRNGILEAVGEIARRSQAPEAEGDAVSLIMWGKTAFTLQSKSLHNKATGCAPESIRDHLEKLRSQYLEALQRQRNHSTLEPLDEVAPLRSQHTEGALKKVHQRKLGLEDICIACDTVPTAIVAQHPLVRGGLCSDCKDTILESMFAYGDDGTHMYCFICGLGGELAVCDNTACNRCLCMECISGLIGPEEPKKVLQSSPWHCYMCCRQNIGLLHCKARWQYNVMQLFQTNCTIAPPPLESYEDRKPVRVLSLFDGIATGKYVLDQVGLEVEKYYASEVDQDAINVATLQHGSSIVQLGPIEILTDVELSQLCPIDLLIGGSPCNDLSLVNPARKGLYDPSGTGRLFFDFYRVLKTLQMGNRGRHLFWMFENVASMPGEYKRVITRFLQCDPMLLDGRFFSPQVRARFFWGNIPGMYSPLPKHILDQNITLSSVLNSVLGREAVVEKIQTVTTRSNSLRQGKHCILPVRCRGQGDVLWITELERLFLLLTTEGDNRRSNYGSHFSTVTDTLKLVRRTKVHTWCLDSPSTTPMWATFHQVDVNNFWERHGAFQSSNTSSTH